MSIGATQARHSTRRTWTAHGADGVYQLQDTLLQAANASDIGAGSNGYGCSEDAHAQAPAPAATPYCVTLAAVRSTGSDAPCCSVLLVLSELEVRVYTPPRVPCVLVHDRLDTWVPFVEWWRSSSFAKCGIVRSSSPVVMLAGVLVPGVMWREQSTDRRRRTSLNSC